MIGAAQYPTLTRALLAYALPADIALAYLALAQRAGEVAALKKIAEETGE